MDEPSSLTILCLADGLLVDTSHVCVLSMRDVVTDQSDAPIQGANVIISSLTTTSSVYG